MGIEEKGQLAISMGVLAIMLGIALALEISHRIEVDSCLDSGGMYGFEKTTCISKQNYKNAEKSLQRKPQKRRLSLNSG